MFKRAELIPDGTVFGKLTVQETVKINGRTMTEVKCECGTVKAVHGYDLRAGKYSSCGKCKDAAPLAEGDVFGKLTVTKVFKEGVFYKATVECECGTVKDVFKSNLLKGTTTTCGCGPRGKPFPKDHGHSQTLAYNSWKKMMARCYDPENKDYKDYGGRGIKVIDHWHEVTNFVKDMGERKQGFSIERVDVNGDYSPGNCIWLPLALQSKNRRPFK